MNAGWPAPASGQPRIAIVGAGFAGIGMALRLLAEGQRNFLLLERASRPGGVWRDNRYPGAACDVQSHLYSFSFRPKPDWQRDYASQAEILGYLDDCVRAGGLEPHLRCGCGVRSARLDGADGCWELAIDAGPALRCDVLVLATGGLSQPLLPAIPGRDAFAGTSLHSARWSAAHDLHAHRVGVIGTGASAIQLVPQLAREAVALTVFQRTPPWILPRRDQAIPAWRQALFARLPWLQRWQRQAIYWRLESHAWPMVRQPALMRLARRAALRHLAQQVPDAGLRARLVPPYTMGCKRILLSDDYLPALSLPQVALVTAPIERIVPQGVQTSDGRVHSCDTLVFATGFATGNRAPPLPVTGRDGMTLGTRWAQRPQAYLGTATHGFPNLFLLVGPNTGLGHSSMILMIEAQVNLVLRCLAETARRQAHSIEVRAEAEHAFNEDVQHRLGHTVWATGCHSWYLNEDGSNSTLWPDFTFRFRARTRAFQPAHWKFAA